MRLAAKLTSYKIDLVASEHASDLDAALQAAASQTDDAPPADDSKRAAFDALFSSATAEGTSAASDSDTTSSDVTTEDAPSEANAPEAEA